MVIDWLICHTSFSRCLRNLWLETQIIHPSLPRQPLKMQFRITKVRRSVTREPLIKTSWSSAATDHLSGAAETLGDVPILLAYRGTTHGVAARDYPIKGFWMTFPGSGFVRAYKIFRAKSLLNEAVDSSNGDPVIRLLRASSFTGFPGPFGTKSLGFEEFEKLAELLNDTGTGSGAAGSPAFGAGVLYSYALALESDERFEEARAQWMRLSQDYPNMPEAKIANWKLN